MQLDNDQAVMNARTAPAAWCIVLPFHLEPYLMELCGAQRMRARIRSAGAGRPKCQPWAASQPIARSLSA
ncbi:hypothetical protein GCM10011576_29190 [Micromonospora parathelypteridis]|nr:hypothetical protein GCM10011576_29190 [Micromonospora parathelypteridis]